MDSVQILVIDAQEKKRLGIENSCWLVQWEYWELESDEVHITDVAVYPTLEAAQEKHSIDSLAANLLDDDDYEYTLIFKELPYG